MRRPDSPFQLVLAPVVVPENEVAEVHPGTGAEREMEVLRLHAAESSTSW